MGPLKKQNGDSREARLWCLIFSGCLRGGMEASRGSRWTVADLQNVNRLYWDQSSAGYWPALICLPFVFFSSPLSQPITSLIGSMSLSLQLHTVIIARVRRTPHCQNTLTSELPKCLSWNIKRKETACCFSELWWRRYILKDWAKPALKSYFLKLMFNREITISDLLLHHLCNLLYYFNLKCDPLLNLTSLSAWN